MSEIQKYKIIAEIVKSIKNNASRNDLKSYISDLKKVIYSNEL